MLPPSICCIGFSFLLHIPFSVISCENMLSHLAYNLKITNNNLNSDKSKCSTIYVILQISTIINLLFTSFNQDSLPIILRYLCMYVCICMCGGVFVIIFWFSYLFYLQNLRTSIIGHKYYKENKQLSNFMIRFEFQNSEAIFFSTEYRFL